VLSSPFGLLHARLTLALPELSSDVSLYGRNLLNRDYFTAGVDFAGPNGFGYYTRYFGSERKLGVELTYHFGSEAE